MYIICSFQPVYKVSKSAFPFLHFPESLPPYSLLFMPRPSIRSHVQQHQSLKLSSRHSYKKLLLLPWPIPWDNFVQYQQIDTPFPCELLFSFFLPASKETAWGPQAKNKNKKNGYSLLLEVELLNHWTSLTSQSLQPILKAWHPFCWHSFPV